MKYFILLIVIVVGVSGIIYLVKGGGPTEDLVVDTYFHNTDVPDWTPMGLAYEAQGKMAPGYLNLQQMRHFVVVVNVPAKRLLAIDQTPDEPKPKPEANMEPDLETETPAVPQPKTEKAYKMSDGRNYPKFVMITKHGTENIPRGVFAWPPKGNPLTEADFQNPDDWFPAPEEKPTKRYRVALYFRNAMGAFDRPFHIKMDDDQTFEVTKEQYDQDHLWE